MQVFQFGFESLVECKDMTQDATVSPHNLSG